METERIDQTEPTNQAANSTVLRRRRTGENVIRTSLTIDVTTAAIIGRLQHSLRLKNRSHTARAIVLKVLSGEITTDEVIQFHRDAWLLIDQEEQRGEPVPFNWSEEIHNALSELATKVLHTDNRSEIFRLLAAFYAVKIDMAMIDFKFKKSARIVI
jgi:hypothetical protein